MKDRLILANQYEILARLSTDEYEVKQYENMRDILYKGYVWGYDLVSEGLYNEMSEVECRFVLDVLDMYGNLYFSWERSDEAKKSIQETLVLFKGFDLNDTQESKYYSFYRFLVEDLNRFNEFKDWLDNGKIDGFNSHGFGPSMEKLERMVQKSKELNKIRLERHDLHFTKDEIEEILNA